MQLPTGSQTNQCRYKTILIDVSALNRRFTSHATKKKLFSASRQERRHWPYRRVFQTQRSEEMSMNNERIELDNFFSNFSNKKISCIMESILLVLIKLVNAIQKMDLKILPT